MSLGPEKNSGNFSEYYPPSNSFGIQPMPSNFIKVQEKPLSQQEGFQFKKKEKALEMPPPLLSPKLQPGLIPKDSNPMNSYFSEFGQKDLQAPPFKSPVCEVRHDVQPMKFPTEMVPNPLQKPLGPDPSNSPMYPIQVAEVKQINPVEQAPPPEVPKGQILVPANRLIETLTSDASNIINKSKGGYDEIMLLNELLTEIKQNMKQKSPSATISFIGSSLIGTYLKSTDADIVFTDFLNPDPISLLTSTISALNIGRTFQSSQVLVFIPHKFKLNFNFFINDEISFEVSSLFKEYCKIDSRCHDLIILSKQWTRTKKIQDCINGFHMSLLVISFLQLSDPPILPRIQQTPHQAKMIGNYDVWFDKNVEFDCQNLCTLGELFQLFLHFLQDLMGYEYALDIKQGVVLECKSDKIYSAPHPFMESEVSQLTKGTEFAQKWVQVLASTLASVDSGERLLKIIA